MTDRHSIFASLQVLRAVAALLVVLFHLRIVEAKLGAEALVLPSALRFADGGVDLFFVISGFVMAIITSGQFRSPFNAARFLGRRLWRVVPLYWFYTTAVLALMALLPAAVNTSYADQSVWASYLLWPQPQLPLLTVGWTLIHEVYFYLVIAAAVAVLGERSFLWFLLAWGLLVAGAQPSWESIHAPWAQVALNPMTLEFIAGALVGRYWRSIPWFLTRLSLPLGIIGLIGAMMLLDRLAGPTGSLPSPYPILRTLLFGPASVLLVLGMVAWERDHPHAMPRFLVLLGDSSYSLYLSHVFALSAIGRLWQMLGPTYSPWHHALFAGTAVAASIAIGLVSYFMLERPLLYQARTWLPRLAPSSPIA
ncbi:acyltransferase family protein [Pseudoxanthomonas wuyuanensis]|uniref:Peptidoglycan/LPS O-acetylase OafA/YrhL, contains acyltransferase and SGNH-hydrolase domains n=1 Tax=Pseudoxanthomonas wuyuanensis TaxID=1073196 RepID=A0A286D7I3_9GAMM|nr:acyltransferase [Pseudoxanthomonas wuyuanensis]KAF1719036.1 acyltransferase [Pseudoxanthomonas wuyuanensis]SOD54590.1 Peptidoglycan/LPS O-acetylase OafA/YrhL, contains acyltransferase and SGNH-hydrolase domains [Pseudoxanthomonas wuyuanensis]